MAAAVEKATGLTVELVEGSGGVFTVSIDGEVVFSKLRSGRFPGEGEIVVLVQRLAAAAAGGA